MIINKPIWDIFCQVIDNWGDAGVCWRLAHSLSQQGLHIRLWIDDPAPLAWMASQQTHTVEIVHWQTTLQAVEPVEAFIEAFGCHAPENYIKALTKQKQPATWINLEYLSAQNYAQDLHGLPSPQQTGAAKGMIRWFYYPGFSPKTGGLLREQNLQSEQASFNHLNWLEQKGIPVITQTLRVSLFCYPNQALPALLQQWQQSSQPIHVLITPGVATREIHKLIPTSHPQSTSPQLHTSQHGQLTLTFLPHFNHDDFDRLLWACDLNMVRGEDSWIRAIWAAKPFIWQPYIQDDNEHIHKLAAFLDLIPHAPQAWQTFEKQWSQQTQPDWNSLYQALPQTQKALQQFKDILCQQNDLVTSLLLFVKEKRAINT